LTLPQYSTLDRAPFLPLYVATKMPAKVFKAPRTLVAMPA